MNPIICARRSYRHSVKHGRRKANVSIPKKHELTKLRTTIRCRHGRMRQPPLRRHRQSKAKHDYAHAGSNIRRQFARDAARRRLGVGGSHKAVHLVGRTVLYPHDMSCFDEASRHRETHLAQPAKAKCWRAHAAVPSSPCVGASYGQSRLPECVTAPRCAVARAPRIFPDRRRADALAARAWQHGAAQVLRRSARRAGRLRAR